MANKAVRRAVIQITILFALAITANAIKPFSTGNVVMHTLSTAQSLSFVLPSAAAERIEQVNYLAQAYGKGLLDAKGSNSVWSPPTSFQAGQAEFIAANFSVEPSAEAEIKDVESCGTGRKAASPKRSVRRVKLGGLRDDREEAHGSAKAKEVARPAVHTVAMAQPASFMGDESNPTDIRLIPASAQFPISAASAKSTNCGEVEIKVAKLVAEVRQLPNLPTMKVAFYLMPQNFTLPSRCRQEKRVEAEESEEVESSTTITGPEEQLSSELFADPMAMPSTPECPKRP